VGYAEQMRFAHLLGVTHLFCHSRCRSGELRLRL